MKGLTSNPDYTGIAIPDDTTEVDNSVPAGWPQKVVFAPAGGPPGAPIQWGDDITNETVEAGFGYVGTGTVEEDLRYFYHSDHLGSTSYITDAKGNAVQYIAYMPFGETLAEQHADWDNPFKFNAKELDSETGLYYYGARYYDPKTSVFIGVDPMGELHPEISVYVYCANSPVSYIDPDGMEFKNPEDEKRACKSQEAAKAKSAEYTTMATDLLKKENLTDEDKAKIADYQAMASILNTHADHLGEMISNTKWQFAYKEVTDPQADLTTGYENGVVIMEYANGEPDKQAHEEVHGYQYIIGELTIKAGKDNQDNYDLSDEANAYQVEYSMRDSEKKNRFISGIGNIKGNPIIKSVNDITPNNLSKSKVIQQMYPQLVKKFNKHK